MGLKIPTGQTNEEDENGNYCPGYLQTGTGSWDPIIELGAHKVMGRNWISAYLMYQKSTNGKRNNEDFKASDVFKYNLGYAFALSHTFDLQLELNGELKSKSELDGEKNENSGGHVIYLTPGVHCKFSRKIHLDFGVPVPVYKGLNGKQLLEDYGVVAKLAFKF